MSRPPDRFAVLDLGTARTRLLAIDLAGGRMRYGGHVSRPSRGLRKGAVVSIDAAVETVRQVAAELESSFGVTLDRAACSLTGTHVRGVGSQAGMALTARSREVTREDTRRVLESARNLPLPEERELLHVLPQEFILDHQGGIQQPVGMLASRLEARLYAITVATPAKDQVVLAANRAGLEVGELIFAPLAAAEAGLTAEERQAGVALVDLGAGSTGVLVCRGGAVVHAGAVAVGGDHFTNDIAVGLSTAQAEAERIKCGFGAASLSYASAHSEIEVPSLGGKPPRLVPHRQLCECIEPRAVELGALLQTELAKAGELPRGIVLTGGGARLAGLRELLEANLRIPVRAIAPPLLEDMPDLLAEPEFGFLVGACYYLHRQLARNAAHAGWWQRLRVRWDEL